MIEILEWMTTTFLVLLAVMIPIVLAGLVIVRNYVFIRLVGRHYNRKT